MLDLGAALKFSNDMVKARNRGNHGRGSISSPERDEQIIEIVGLMAVKKSINKKRNEKHNRPKRKSV